MPKTRALRCHRATIMSLVLTGVLLVSPVAASALPRAGHRVSQTTSSTGMTPMTRAQVGAAIAELAIQNKKLAERINKTQAEVVRTEQAAAQATGVASVAQR